MAAARKALAASPARGRSPSCEALKIAFTELYRLEDFDQREKLGAGFFGEVFRVVHRVTGRVLVLKMNRQGGSERERRELQSLARKEIQTLGRLEHPNLLRLEAVCIHAGQLHALTEFMDGGTLEELLQSPAPLSWCQRAELSLQVARGLEYLHGQGVFHRDLTSKNVFLRQQPRTALIGDFGLATEIPGPGAARLPQVGSPYWMSPECLRGEHYDQRADVFSFGILLCETIARVEADPDCLPRTQNFGVEYAGFSRLVGPDCPPDFLKLALSCVAVGPASRPPTPALVTQLARLLRTQRQQAQQPVRQRAERSVSERVRPAERARVHQRSLSDETCAARVCEEYCLLDPFYQAPPDSHTFLNPFATLPRLGRGRKIIGCSSYVFSRAALACPTPPRPPSPARPARRSSLPASPAPTRATTPPLQLALASQDDSAVVDPSWAGLSWPGAGQAWREGAEQTWQYPLRRAGSLESGFHSSSLSHTRSVCSSLLTVSDLEEDLRAASALLSTKRSSSVFTDSLDDLSSGLDDLNISGIPLRGYHFTPGGKAEKFEKDIREIVEYFERNCPGSRVATVPSQQGEPASRTSPETARSQKIESLIKKVAENKSRARLGTRHSAGPQLQVCDGIVRSKLPLFDCPPSARRSLQLDQRGFVQARRAMFDREGQQKPRRKLVSDFLLQQRRTAAKSSSSSIEKGAVSGPSNQPSHSKDTHSQQ